MFQTSNEQFLSLLPPWCKPGAFPVVYCGYGYGAEEPVHIGEANTFFEVSSLVAANGYYASNIIRMDLNGRMFFVAHCGKI